MNAERNHAGTWVNMTEFVTELRSITGISEECAVAAWYTHHHSMTDDPRSAAMAYANRFDLRLPEAAHE